MDFAYCLSKLREQLEDYIKKYNINALVIGVSGGLDSAVNAVICNAVCEKIGIPFYSYYLNIGNMEEKREERNRAENIGKCFTSNFTFIDLTEEYLTFRDACETSRHAEYPTFEDKIRRGNIKARMRMTFLRDATQYYHGIGIDNTNYTEWQLGFFTKNDDMDLSPLADMWKSDEYRFAEFLLTTLKKDSEKEALQACIDAIPTDGLGITSSDLEQIGCKSYFDVDDILKTLIPLEEKKKCGIKEFDEKWKELEIKYGVMEVQKVWERHINSEFKRKGRKTLNIYTNRF